MQFDVKLSNGKTVRVLSANTEIQARNLANRAIIRKRSGVKVVSVTPVAPEQA